MPQHTYCDDKRGGRDRDACSKKTAGGDQAGNGAYPAVSVGEVREGDLSLGIAKTLPEQTYEITIDEKGGQISGGDGAGVLYGVETFCQIVQQCGGILPCVQIQDAPDMPNRGYYFDQTRGRVLKLEELKKLQTGCAAIN